MEIEYIDINGETLDKQNSRLLKAEGVNVEVNGFGFEAKKNQNGVYTYSGSLERTDQNLTISNEIGLYHGKKNISLGTVYEPYMRLSLEMDTDTPLVLDKNGRANLVVKVWNTNEGKLLTEDDWNHLVEMTCESEFFNSDCKNFVFLSDGSVSIPVYLKNVDEHKINKIEKFKMAVHRSYSDGIRIPAATGDVYYDVKVTSEPHKLSASVASTPTNIIGMFFLDKDLSVEYYCDDKKLTNEQKKEVASKLVCEDSTLENFFTLKEGDIHLKKSRVWFDFDEKNCSVKLTYSYTKWNQTSTANAELLLNLNPLSPMQKRILHGSVIIMVIVFFLILAKICWFLFFSNRSDDYISFKTKFQFEWTGGEVLPMKLKWGCFNKIVFRAKGKGRYICVRSKRDDQEIRLYIKKNGKDNTWKLCEQRKTLPLNGIEINGQNVSERNDNFVSAGKGNNILVLKMNKQPDAQWQLVISKDKD